MSSPSSSATTMANTTTAPPRITVYVITVQELRSDEFDRVFTITARSTAKAANAYAKEYAKAIAEQKSGDCNNIMGLAKDVDGCKCYLVLRENSLMSPIHARVVVNKVSVLAETDSDSDISAEEDSDSSSSSSSEEEAGEHEGMEGEAPSLREDLPQTASLGGHSSPGDGR